MQVFILAIFAVSCSTSTESATTSATSTYPSDDYCPIEEIKTCGAKYGVPATKRQFPYVAFLKSRNAYKVQYCSGSLIHPKWVLTSAYCTLPHSIVEVTLGALIPFDEEDPDRIIVVSEIVYIHPEYLPRYKNPKNDVALIKLSRPVTSDAVNTIPLKSNSGPISKDNIVFAAWGEAAYETLTFTTNLTIYKGRCYCKDIDGKQKYEDAEADWEILCGHSRDHFCFLHNGAALVVNGVLVAVMSMRCFSHCRHDEGTFTNVYQHLQWINNTLNADCSPQVYISCSDIKTAGVYLIQPNYNVKAFEVYCDIVDDKKYTVIQQRLNGSVDFYRNYANYTMGFGPINGNHWLGLEKIHQLTKNGGHELRVELQAHNLTRGYARYSTFKVGSAETGFKLTIFCYSGNAGDSMITEVNNDNLNGMKFSTFDNDQDMYIKNCAKDWRGAWWYNRCTVSHLNSPYRDTAVPNEKTMFWFYNFDWVALKSSRMLIRKKESVKESCTHQKTHREGEK